MRLTIVGAGYVGLTTGAAFAYLGHVVTCLDVDEQKIRTLQQGELPIYEPGLPEFLDFSKGRLRFTTDYQEAIPGADVIFIAVGTPLMPDGSSDLEHVKAASREIGKYLGDGHTLIVNKSTVPIGSGDWVEALVSDAFETEHGRKAGDVFSVASNPEFLREGSAFNDTFYPDRIVVGSKDARAIETLARLYRPIINQDFPPPSFLPRPEGMQAVPLVTTDLASAELIKYAANSFLGLKISFINEIACLAEKVGADILQIARGIGLDNRIGSRFLNAGIGWGGSCFGKDAAALASTAKEYGYTLSIVEAAREVNYRQRERVIEKLLVELKILKGKRIGILGLAFKPNTDDLRDAPALDIAKKLLERGTKVVAHDPVALSRARKEAGNSGIEFTDRVEEVFAAADAVVLATEWNQYRSLPYADLIASMRNPVILDGRNFLNRDQLVSIGYRYFGVGR